MKCDTMKIAKVKQQKQQSRNTKLRSSQVDFDLNREIACTYCKHEVTRAKRAIMDRTFNCRSKLSHFLQISFHSEITKESISGSVCPCVAKIS